MVRPTLFLVLLSFVVCFKTTKIVAIEKKQAYVLTAVSGISSMAATEILLECLKRYGYIKNNRLTNLGISAGVGLLCALISYSISSRYTPESKVSNYIFECENINNFLSDIEKDSLLNREFLGNEDLLTAILIRFDNRFPLYLAKVYLEEKTRMLNGCINSLKGICTTYQNLSEDPECQVIFQNCREGLEKRLKQFSQKISSMLEKITQHPQYKNHFIEYLLISSESIRSSFLINVNFDSPIDFLVKMTNFFGTNWPLVIACEKITEFARNLDALINLSKAEKLYQHANNVFYNLIKRVEELQKIILTHPAYMTQVELYENYQKCKREMEIKQKELENQAKLQEMKHQEKLCELSNQQKIQELSASVENQKKKVQHLLEQNKHFQSIIDNKNLTNNKIPVA